MWCWTGSSGWLMPIGMVLMVAFWGTAIGFGVWLISRWARSSDYSGNGALAVARERYARGEISKEEFERLRRDLS